MMAVLAIHAFVSLFLVYLVTHQDFALLPHAAAVIIDITSTMADAFLLEQDHETDSKRRGS